MANMGQAERDRYNIKRGGTAGLPYLIKVGETPAAAKTRFDTAQAGTPANAGVAAVPTTGTAANAPGIYTPPTLPGAAESAIPATFTPEAFLKSWQTQYDKANAANETRYKDILGGYGQLANQYGQMYSDQSLANQQAADQINQGYKARYDRGLANLEGAGVQAMSDIRQQYGATGANVQQNLRNRGMAGTTIAPTMQLGVQREQLATEGRLNEQLRKERLAVDSGLSGDSLAAYQQQNAMRAGLAGTYAQGLTGIGQNTLNFKERREDVVPDFGTYASLAMKLGQGGLGAGGGGGSITTIGPGGNKAPNFNHFDRVNENTWNRYTPERTPSWITPAGSGMAGGSIGGTGGAGGGVSGKGDLGLGNTMYGGNPTASLGGGGLSDYDYFGGEEGGWDFDAGSRGAASRSVPRPIPLVRPKPKVRLPLMYGTYGR